MSPSLPTRRLGSDGPEVTALGFGLMGLSAYYGKPLPDDQRLALLDHIYASGCLNWDSADIYGDSEELVGRWLKANPSARSNIFLATKFANYVDPTTGARRVRNEPDYIRSSIDKSLARLGVDSVDLWYCHRIDKDIPIEETVKVMQEVRESGKCRYLGLSEVGAETLRRACRVVKIDAVQIEYSPFTMDIEDERVGLLKACRELGVATVAYSPLGRGFLTGTLKSPDDFEEGDFRTFAPRFNKENFHKNLELVDALAKIAEKKGCTNGQLVLAWLMSQGDDIIPIPGTTKIKNFDENMAALKVKITKEDDREIRKLIESADVKGERYPPAFAKALFVDTVPLKE